MSSPSRRTRPQPAPAARQTDSPSPARRGASAVLLALLRERLPEVLQSIAPLVGVVCVLQFTIVQAPAALFIQFLGGALLVVLGLLLLFAGVEIGVLPMGRYIGADLPTKGSAWLIAIVGFAMGFATTAAEPDVLILADQVDRVTQGAISGQQLVYVIAAGVGLLAVVALLRIVYGFSFRALLAGCWLLMIALSLLAPASFVPLAYDAGSVTTGVVAAPALLALALGVSSVLAGRSTSADGFGLLGLASAGPILAILLVGVFAR
ncbi:MAG TPA: DUF1538 domain-containing protein [Ramlibacter sp.]|uniref:DUF1538 domain-containing protein n=1 Tax=Ramlibacter sp. TaxID=1917967 RepID=UPI002D7E7E89|nr:DUF1538 domain-containing protein [Ramlibacter sp.]HET8748999.1 DUF1538 domain-containing protein [Ramlibacter sp.]